MTPPGNRIRALGARLCSPRTMERLIDPMVADLQTEYGDAVRQRRGWRSRWIRIAGCVVFLKAVSLHACSKSIAITFGWTDEDRRAFGRMIAFSAAAMVVAAICSAASFATLAWVTPAANQAFRELMYDLAGKHGPLLKGANELSLGELSQRIAALTQVGHWGEARTLALDYHFRWALSCATLVLAAFAISIVPRRGSVHTWMLSVLLIVTYVGYYALMFAGRAAALAGTVPTFVGAWLANAMFVMIAIATLKRRATTD
jgi:lipopolysaccharide export LptBFGC system permease protein LptF